jgi:hypothetical protein
MLLLTSLELADEVEETPIKVNSLLKGFTANCRGCTTFITLESRALNIIRLKHKHLWDARNEEGR